MAKRQVMKGKRIAREEYVEVLLSSEEKRAIETKANALGMSLSGFLRTAALERAGRIALV